MMNRVQRNRWLRRLGIALALHTAIGFLVLPAIIKRQPLQRLPALTHRAAAIDQARLNPSTLAFTLRGLRRTEPDGAAFAGIDEFHANCQLAAVVLRSGTFKEVRLVPPAGHVALAASGTPNFANPIPTADPDRSPGPPRIPRVRSGERSVTNAVFLFTDHGRPEPFATATDPINIHLANFSAKPASDNPYSFAATTETSASLEYEGNVFLVPLRSDGSRELMRGRTETVREHLLAHPGLAAERLTAGEPDLAAATVAPATQVVLALE